MGMGEAIRTPDWMDSYRVKSMTASRKTASGKSSPFSSTVRPVSGTEQNVADPHWGGISLFSQAISRYFHPVEQGARHRPPIKDLATSRLSRALRLDSSSTHSSNSLSPTPRHPLPLLHNPADVAETRYSTESLRSKIQPPHPCIDPETFSRPLRNASNTTTGRGH